mmetsp:Transcript_5353/g.15546  ORF Transcript_5353/g.15546 Transcript_5353/m.15546 type:complete len:82 (-) Transcript_5353:1307-1552(-)
MQGKGRQLGPIKRSTTPRMSFRLRKELAKPHLWAQQSIAQLGGVSSMPSPFAHLLFEIMKTTLIQETTTVTFLTLNEVPPT